MLYPTKIKNLIIVYESIRKMRLLYSLLQKMFSNNFVFNKLSASGSIYILFTKFMLVIALMQQSINQECVSIVGVTVISLYPHKTNLVRHK